MKNNTNNSPRTALLSAVMKSIPLLGRTSTSVRLREGIVETSNGRIRMIYHTNHSKDGRINARLYITEGSASASSIIKANKPSIVSHEYPHRYTEEQAEAFSFEIESIFRGDATLLIRAFRETQRREREIQRKGIEQVYMHGVRKGVSLENLTNMTTEDGRPFNTENAIASMASHLLENLDDLLATRYDSYICIVNDEFSFRFGPRELLDATYPQTIDGYDRPALRRHLKDAFGESITPFNLERIIRNSGTYALLHSYVSSNKETTYVYETECISTEGLESISKGKRVALSVNSEALLKDLIDRNLSSNASVFGYGLTSSYQNMYFVGEKTKQAFDRITGNLEGELCAA